MSLLFKQAKTALNLNKIFPFLGIIILFFTVSAVVVET